jgi:fructokinase
MPAVIYTGTNLAFARRPNPVLSGDCDVLIRVVATGICGTDRSIALGAFPAAPGVILGHEAAGVVVIVSPGVTAVQPGERVVINPTYYCLGCRYCRRGMMAHCPAKEGREIGVDRDGTLTDFIAIPQRFVHRIPDGMSCRRAALVEPLACVLNNLMAANPRWDDRILVLGAGPIGTLCALVLSARGSRVTIAEVDPQRAALARDILPKKVAVAGGAASRPDVIIDTVGTLLETAFDAVENNGTIVVMGEREGATARVGLRALVTRGVRIIGAGPYSPAAFEMALDLAEELPLESLITHTLPLESYAHAFDLLAAGPSGHGYGAMKVLLVSDGEAL